MATTTTTNYLSSLVIETLRADASHRKPGVLGDLIAFEQVQFGREWDHSLPTLVKEFTYSKSRVRRATVEQFKQKFFEKFPELERINWTNLLCAGGCVGHHLVSDAGFVGDIDFFVYGLRREVADLRVVELVKQLIAARKRLEIEKQKQQQQQQQQQHHHYQRAGGSAPQLRLKIIRNSNGLSLFIDDRLYQIIFRLYESPSEVLHGFDLGSAAVGFNGSTVLFTTLSKFAYEFEANIVDTTRRSTTYEARLQKYFARGFRIILPLFDMAKVRTEYLKFGLQEMLLMPFLKLSYGMVVGNQIVVSRFFKTLVVAAKKKPGDAESDAPATAAAAVAVAIDDETPAAQQTDYALDDVGEFNLLYINLAHLLVDPSKLYHFAQFRVTCAEPQPKRKRDEEEEQVDAVDEDGDGEGEGDGGDDDDDNERPKRARKSEATTAQSSSGKQKAQGDVDDELTIDRFFLEPPFLSAASVSFFYATLRKKAFEKRCLAVGKLEKYVTVESIQSIATRIFINGEDANAVLDDVFKRQEALVQSLVREQANKSRPFPWIVTDPGTQLTSSINPILAEPAAWYGEYMKL